MAKSKQAYRIVFMGTPDFAIPSLERLLEAGYEVVGVITAPDKPAGRGQKLRASPVKKFAKKHDLNILQPKNLKDKAFQQRLSDLEPDLQVVVAFRMLPESVFSLPEDGTINLHASLLPQYRGAAPINWAIINGEEETGVTTFFIEQQIDTGKLLFQEKTPIKADDTAGTLHDRLMEQGAELVLKTVEAIRTGDYEEQPQPKTGDFKKAPKIQKSDCKIDWNQPVQNVYDFIRGLAPYPVAWTILNGKQLRIFWAEQEVTDHSQAPGTVKTDEKTYLKVAARKGWIDLKQIQLAGKKRMSTETFLRGYKAGAFEIE